MNKYKTYHLEPAVSLTCFLSNLLSFVGSFGGMYKPSISSEAGLNSKLFSRVKRDLNDREEEDEAGTKDGSLGSQVKPIKGLFSDIFQAMN